MDAFTISTGVAGFLSLALEISKILKAYVDGVKSAPEEARNLLAEVTALCHALEQLMRFLRKDYKGNFAETSVLVVAIEACKDQITELYKKIEKIEVNCENGKVSQFMQRLKWPLRKEDYDSTISTVQRFTQTFQFSLTISNCELLAKTSEEVLTEFKVKENQLEQTIQSFKSMQLPIEQLLTASKKQSEIFGDVIEILKLGRETQKKILAVVQNTNGIANDQEMESLLQWISPLEPQTRHQDVRSKRLPNTGNWFLNSEVFRNWRDDSDGVNIFGCYGIPGAGKTFISSLVIDHLSSRFTGEKVCIAFIYCDYRDRKQQTAVNMIGGLLKQAITASKQGCRDVVQSLLEKKKGRGPIEVDDVVHALSRLLRGFDKTYICIDALDECNEEPRRHLIRCLAGLSSSSDRDNLLPIRLFFTGRPPMEQYVKSHSAVEPKIPLMVKLEANTEDIAAYVAHKIDEDKMVKMDDEFKKHIVAEIVSASQGMFLLPALQIEAVLDEPTIRKRRKALQDMPKKLNDVFGITLKRIRNQKPSVSSLAMSVLQWIFLAARPLSLEELRHALAVESGDTDLDRDNFVEAQFILDCCLGLVIVDESTSTIRLVHKSLQDYFQEQYNQGLLFIKGHMKIASICMTYMVFDSFNQEVTTLKANILQQYALLEYAAIKWDYHLRSSNISDSAVEDMAVTLLVEKYKTNLALKIFLASRLENWYYFNSEPENQLSYLLRHQSRNPKWKTKTFPLHIAASTGCPELFHRVFDYVEVDINATDAWNNYPLTLATIGGHRSLIEIILDRRYNANVNVQTKDCSTALLLAAQWGHSEIVKMLLEEDGVEVNKANNQGYTPLLLAAEFGHSEVVKILLEEDVVDVDMADNHGFTPLLLAAEEGDSEIVKILLEEDGVDVNKADNRGSTPLLLAAERGYSEIMKMLLEEDGVDVNKADNRGSTPLLLAAQWGHSEIVKMLLEEDGVDVNKADNRGSTPLLLAAGSGHSEIVKMLLEEDGVDVNKVNDDGSTPLSDAACEGHSEVVKMLIEHGATVDTRNNGGRTPLSRAAQHHRSESLNILLESSADLNTKDETHGRTPLMWSFYKPESWNEWKDYHNFDTLKALLSQQDINVNWKADDGSTALSRAIECELHEAEELLRAHGAV